MTANRREAGRIGLPEQGKRASLDAMPSSRASRLAAKMASSSAARRYIVGGESVPPPDMRPSESKGKQDDRNARAQRDRLGSLTTATVSDWSAGFSLLMARLEPDVRATVAETVRALATDARAPSRRDAFERMTTAADQDIGRRRP